MQLAGGSDSARIKTYDAIEGKLTAPGLTSQVGGQVPTYSAINKEVTADIGRAEVISMPVLLILMLIIFGSLAAASLPLAIGAIGILGSFAALRLLTLVTGGVASTRSTSPRSSAWAWPSTTGCSWSAGSARNCTGSRRPRTRWPRTVATAGRTVAVSGVTVAVALAGLMLFPETFLRSMGYGGVATVAGRHAGRADRAARPAGRARAAGQRAAGPPQRRAGADRTSRAAPGTGSRAA